MNQFEQRYAGNVGVVPYGAYAVVSPNVAATNPITVSFQFTGADGNIITDPCMVYAGLYDSTGATIEALVGGGGTTAFGIENSRGLFLNTLTAATDNCISPALTMQVTTQDTTPNNTNSALSLTVTDAAAETLMVKIFNIFGECIYQSASAEFTWS